MSPEAYDDFVSELYWAVYEELALYEVTHGAIDRLSTGDVRHGPWLATDCAEILMRWLRGELLGLYRYTPTRDNGPNLTATEAVDALSATDRWVMSEDWTQVAALFLTEKGQSTPFSDWKQIAARPQS